MVEVLIVKNTSPPKTNMEPQDTGIVPFSFEHGVQMHPGNQTKPVVTIPMPDPWDWNIYLFSKKLGHSYTGWWFHPIRKILVKLELFPKIEVKIKKCLKPPPSIG